MKKYYYTLVCMFFVSFVQSQNPRTSFQCDYKPSQVLSNSNQRLGGTPNTEYGGVFTPKDEFRALVIFAGFGAPYDNMDVAGWPTGSNTFPNSYNDNKTFYSLTTQFDAVATANDAKNVSRFYYEMSKGNFKFMADIYPTRINVNFDGATNWDQMNKKVLEKMKLDDPNFDWSKYDNKTNFPNYLSDNSNSSPDDKPDYVIICYRYTSAIGAPSNVGSWDGSGGGYSRMGLNPNNFTYNGYSFDGAGFTFPSASTDPFTLFLHEIGHELYGCPHYANQNGVVGDFYFAENSYGMMNINSSACSSANAYERWLLGWTKLEANGVNSNLKSATDLNSSGTYQLRDFITTGDALRIKISDRDGLNQYLWLENHQGTSIFDTRAWNRQNNGCEQPFPASPTGLFAYYENINDDKTAPKSFNSFGGPNGIKILNALGNFNFSISGLPSYPCNIWSDETSNRNPIYNFIQLNENCFVGNSRVQGLRFDFNNDNKILLRNFGNNRNEIDGLPNETYGNIKTNGIIDYLDMGGNMNFDVGRKIGIGSNPAISNRPIFDQSSNKLSPYYINNISFEVLEKLTNGDIKVKIRFDDNEIAQNRIWAGNIVLPDVSNNANPDLVLKENIILTYTKNGTSDRTTKHPFTGDFTNPSLFELASNSNLILKPNATLIIEKGSTFILNSNAILEISDGAKVKIQTGASINIKSGAKLIVRGKGKLQIENDGYLCMENNANVNLVDFESLVKLNSGYKVGLNPLLYPNSSSCTVSPITYSKTGLGNIKEYTADNYIQNQIFNSSQYVSGINIFAGTSVTNLKPQGPVLIQTGGNVIFDSNNGVLLDRGFEVQLGATFMAK